ncbi:DNA gyrase inhibitor YacG [Celerinatantimonas sp. MCCC 1A17872]|uniref:DNA gyrase inhibitor YacG n=1 Tax=Celerinatantimonas sp. MCCC 1A17872 TaxID=3177514 RepID=UPI0038C57EEA
MSKVTLVNCPICHKQCEYSQDNPWRPFCSERCKLIDLGEWANEEKAIPGQSIAEDEDKPDSWNF